MEEQLIRSVRSLPEVQCTVGDEKWEIGCGGIPAHMQTIAQTHTDLSTILLELNNSMILSALTTTNNLILLM